MRSLERNIRWFKLYMFLNRLDMWQPVVVLFVLERGFTLTEYAVVDAVWYVSTVIFEVPTGLLTDRYGKKPSLCVALLSQAAALFVLACATSFLALFVSYVLWGFASSFETGTTDAFVFDSLKQMRREGEYRKIAGTIKTLVILAAAFGSILAGLLGGIGLALPIVATASIALLLLPLMFLLNEPDVSDVRQPSHWLHLKESLRYLRRHRPVTLLLLYPAIMETAVWGLYMFYQPLLRSFHVSVQHMGLLYFCFRLLGAAGARLSDPAYKVAGRACIYLIPGAFAACVLCLGLLVTPWAIGAIFVIFFLAGLYYPTVNALVNQSLPSGSRATILSAGSVLSCSMGAIAYPLLASLADATSLHTGITALSIGFVALMAPVLVLLGRQRLGLHPQGVECMPRSNEERALASRHPTPAGDCK
jgi:MFS family permease